MLGIFALNMQGMAGGMIQMVNHGISTGALFLIVGFIYERRHTREINEFGGLAKQMPIFATIFMIITFSSIGLPGTNGFVGEFLVLMGAFQSGLRWYAVFATSGVILAAVYMLWMFQRVMFGELKNPANQKLKDLSVREVVIMLPLLVFVFWIGFYPNTFFDKMNPARGAAHRAGQGTRGRRPGEAGTCRCRRGRRTAGSGDRRPRRGGRRGAGDGR